MQIKDLCFEIIQKCPNNCIFCSSNSNYDRKDIIDFETFKNTIKFFCDNGGIKEISLSGGEPLLHPQIIEIIKLCKQKNIYIRPILLSFAVPLRHFAPTTNQYL